MVSDMRSITKQYLADGIHPTDQGYKMMAAIWFVGIRAAHSKGWIQRPIGQDPPAFGSNTKAQTVQTVPVVPKKRRCLTEPRLVALNKGQYITDLTAGQGRNGQFRFIPKWLERGQVNKGQGLQAAGIHFADLNGDGALSWCFNNLTFFWIT